jgi:hypothetical protein
LIIDSIAAEFGLLTIELSKAALITNPVPLLVVAVITSELPLVPDVLDARTR